MQVMLKHLGYIPPTGKHVYSVLTDSGIADTIYEDEYTSATSVTMPDILWGATSGWADVECDVCGAYYRERTAPGEVVACPVCGHPLLVPPDAVLEWSNKDE